MDMCAEAGGGGVDRWGQRRAWGIMHIAEYQFFGRSNCITSRNVSKGVLTDVMHLDRFDYIRCESSFALLGYCVAPDRMSRWMGAV